jgi:hypothetical protein
MAALEEALVIRGLASFVALPRWGALTTAFGLTAPRHS